VDVPSGEVTSGRPAGFSIGRALDVPAGPLYDGSRETVAAIDRIHGVGGLPRIPVRFAYGTRELGRFLFDSQTGEPISILVRSNQVHRELSLVHEIGHVLDLAALGAGIQFGSRCNPILEDWGRAVTASSAFRLLQDVGNRRRVKIVDASGSAHDASITQRERELIDMWLQPEELWARSYAQFVAAHGSLPALITSLDAFRARVPGKVYYPLQWDEDDFAAVDITIDALFRTLGWRT
jgi:hypothetical protein